MKNGASNGHHGLRWQVRVIVPGQPLQSSTVLLSAGSENILVDTGFSHHDALVIDGIQRCGLEIAQVTGIINTHYHLDHFGGNHLFPQAWVFGSKIDFDWAVSIYESVSGGETRREVFRTFYPEARDEEFDRMDEARVLELLKWMWDPSSLGDRKRYRWCEQEQLGISGLRVLPTPGHSPGHLSVMVDGLDGPYVVAGDARSFISDGTIGYDMPPHNHAAYRRSRALLDSLPGTLIPGHDDPFEQSQPVLPVAGEFAVSDLKERR